MPNITVIKGHLSYWENAIIRRKMQALFWENYWFFAFRLLICLRLNVQATPKNTKLPRSCRLGSGTTADRDRLAFSPEVFYLPLVSLSKGCWSVRKRYLLLFHMSLPSRQWHVYSSVKRKLPTMFDLLQLKEICLWVPIT